MREACPSQLECLHASYCRCLLPSHSRPVVPSLDVEKHPLTGMRAANLLARDQSLPPAPPGVTNECAGQPQLLSKTTRLEQLSTRPLSPGAITHVIGDLCSLSLWRWLAHSSGGTSWGRAQGLEHVA